MKKVSLEISQNSQEDTCASPFFNKVASLRLWKRCFPVNFVKFLRTPFYTQHLLAASVFLLSISHEFTMGSGLFQKKTNGGLIRNDMEYFQVMVKKTC